MAEVEDLNSYFSTGSDDGLPQDIRGEMESIMRLHSISAQELFYKWESYSLKMGSEETKLNLDTVRMFKRDVQDGLERENRGKHTGRTDRRAAMNATPRGAGTGGIHGMLDEITPNTLPRRAALNGNSVKRKAPFGTPTSSKAGRTENRSSPSAQIGGQGGPKSVPFSERKDAGQIVETLNDQLPIAEAPIAPFAESRIKFTSNTDVKKFSYKPMSMRLTENARVLDERIDDFTALVKKVQSSNEDTPGFGSAATQSPNEIIAVGRIASDTPEAKLTATSIVLETATKVGSARRVPLRLDNIPFSFFPGQIVALRGKNASGTEFVVAEILPIPFLPDPRSAPSTIETNKERLGDTPDSSPLNILIASGPYTSDDNLAFEPFQALCRKAAEDSIDALILSGPFIDIEHPLITQGDIDLPTTNATSTTLSTLFRTCISTPLQSLTSANPNMTIILLPSPRDACAKHVSWPQEPLARADLGLPKQVRMMPNPCTFWLNEVVVAVSAQDILAELRREEVRDGKGLKDDLLMRLPRHLIQQRHYFPLFPAAGREKVLGDGEGLTTGACLDIGYLKLGEMLNVRPDVLVTPSVLSAFARVVEGVTVVNPGTLSKKRGPGTFSQMSLQPRTLSVEELGEKSVLHKVYERARIDVVRI